MKLNRVHKAAGIGLAASLALSTVAVPSAFASSATLSYAGGWPTTGVANPANTSNNIVDTGIAYAPLAYYKFTGNYDYWPVLAKSWKYDDKQKTFTVTLNPNAKWSDGTKVTANDVYVTFELQFLSGNASSWSLSSMKVLNPETIVFYRDPKALYSTVMFERQILNNTKIVSAQNYEKYIPSNIWTLVKQANGNPNAASTKSAQTALTAASTKATGVNFQLNQLLYSGPWSLSRTNSSQQLYVKNPNFVFAKNINADQVLDINQSTNDVTWRALQNGQLDYAGVGYSPTVYQSVMKVHQNSYDPVPQSTGMALFFNQKTYPFNMVQVRQALAYVINRDSVQKIGEPIGGFKAVYEDGMIESINKQWLTAAQINSLNTYAANPAKATALLKSVGFKKSGANWIMPNGKPFKFNIYAPNYSDWDQGVDAMASQLQQFGIQASASVIDATTFGNEELLGKYGVFTEWWGGWDLAPSQTYNQLYISDNNYQVSTTGQLSKKPGPSRTEIPAAITVPGLGTVNPMALTVKLLGDQSLAAEKQTIYQLAKATNATLPYIPIWSQAAGRTYSTERWNWPDFLHNTALANQMVYQNPIAVYETLGLMKPKQ